MTNFRNFGEGMLTGRDLAEIAKNALGDFSGVRPIRVIDGPNGSKQVQLDPDYQRRTFVFNETCTTSPCGFDETSIARFLCQTQLADLLDTLPPVPDGCESISVRFTIEELSGSPSWAVDGVPTTETSFNKTVQNGLERPSLIVQGTGPASGFDCFEVKDITITGNGSVSGPCRKPECESCLGGVVASPVYVDGDTGLAYARCCEPFLIYFLYLEPWEIECLKKFTCAGDADSCFCENDDFNDCTANCSVFSAEWNERTNRWESDYRFQGVTVAETTTPISSSEKTLKSLGCGKVIPRKVITDEELERFGCCDPTVVRVLTETMQASRPSSDGSFEIPPPYNKFRFDVEPPESDCPYYCLIITIDPPPQPSGPDPGTPFHAVEIKVIDGEQEVLLVLGDGNLSGRVCLTRHASIQIHVNICLYDWTAETELQPSLEFGLTVDWTTQSDACDTGQCSVVSTAPLAYELDVLHIGEFIPRESLVQIARDLACRYHITEYRRPRAVPPCDCFRAADICKYMTTQFFGVSKDKGDDTTGMEFEPGDYGPCACKGGNCEDWSDRLFELQYHVKNPPGEGNCTFALVNRGHVSDDIPCGPYDLFPCQETCDATEIVAEVLCEPFVIADLDCDEDYVGTGTTDEYWTLRVPNFTVSIKGCELFVYRFPAVLIPVDGDFCVRADRVCHTTTDFVDATVCRFDMSGSNGRQWPPTGPGGGNLCDQVLPAFVTMPAGSPEIASPGTQYCYPPDFPSGYPAGAIGIQVDGGAPMAGSCGPGNTVTLLDGGAVEIGSGPVLDLKIVDGVYTYVIHPLTGTNVGAADAHCGSTSKTVTTNDDSPEPKPHLVAAHDINNCRWEMADENMPILCFYRC